MSPDRFLDGWPEGVEKPRRYEPLGTIEVHAGPMFSGKSDDVISTLRTLQVHVDLMVERGETSSETASQLIRVFKPDIDDRRGTVTINSQNGDEWPAIPIKNSNEIMNHISPLTGVVVFDETQFFDMGITRVAEELANNGVRVIVAGLDRDFRGEPFGPMGDLLLIADNVEKHTAVCACCGRDATRTQRVIVQKDGVRKPARYDDPIILVGATESYESRCRDCHDVPGKSEK